MPKLSELTDYDPMGNAQPALPAEIPPELKRVYITGEKELPVKFSEEPTAPAESSPLSNNIDKILNSIFRSDEKRLQLWPERLVREGLTAAGDVASGKVPTLAIDPVTGDVHTSPEMIEKAQAVSALAGTGGLGGTGKARLSTKDLEKVNTDPMPVRFKVGTKDDTGIWFLDGDKPIYAQAKRDSLDKLFGDRAKEFDNFQSVSGTSEKGGPITVWYREGQKDKALKEIQNFKDKQAASTNAEKAKLHYESGVNLGYPEEAARAYAYQRFGVDPAPGGEVVLGATPSLRPALKHKEKLYKGKPGQEHQDIIPDSLYNDFQKKAMSGQDLAEYNFGFVNDKGHFLNREQALEYGIANGLIDPHAGKFGVLTSTMFSDSSKPGVAIEAMKNNPLIQQAKDHFGLTRNPKEAGYVMPDGSMLDFSGRHYADYKKVGNRFVPQKGSDYLANQRNVDHRELHDILEAPVNKITGQADNNLLLSKFMNDTGAVRNFPGIGFETSAIPTDKQLKSLIGGHNSSYKGDPLKIDLAYPSGEVYATFDFAKPNLESIKKWINNNFKAKSDTVNPLPPGYELKPVAFNPFEQKT